MPTYTYECKSCGVFEYEQSITHSAIECCPRCGGVVRKVITGGIGFVLKGQGASVNHCERDSPCCGRDTRCDKPPCDK